MKSLPFLLSILCLKEAECLSWRQILGETSPFSFDPPVPVPSRREFPAQATVRERVSEASKVNELASALKEGITSAESKLQEDMGLEEMPTGIDSEKEETVQRKKEFMSGGLEGGAGTFSEVSPASVDATAEEKSEESEFRKDILKTMENPGEASAFSESEIAELGKDFAGAKKEECIRDYSQQCPLHFSPSSNLCIALSTYTGPCSKVQKDIYRFSDDQKAIWAKACGADFPCMPEKCPNGTNYRRQCPVGWLSFADGTCSAPEGYELCEKEMNMRGVTHGSKASLEKPCGMRWPCMPAFCPRDFSKACPEGWEETQDKKCQAPKSYHGPCSKVANMRDFVGSSEKKFSFEQKCLVSWPCLDGIRGRERDYEAKCPLGWIEMSNGFCQAPASFAVSSQCPEQISFENASPSEKESFSLLCNVDFPFIERGNCKRDLTSRCPIGWLDVNDGVNCEAPESYAGKCERIAAYGKLDDAKKQEKIRTCDVDWPCLGEWTEGLLVP